MKEKKVAQKGDIFQMALIKVERACHVKRKQPPGTHKFSCMASWPRGAVNSGSQPPGEQRHCLLHRGSSKAEQNQSIRPGWWSC